LQGSKEAEAPLAIAVEGSILASGIYVVKLAVNDYISIHVLWLTEKEATDYFCMHTKRK
jgi:hypothetical protein